MKMKLIIEESKKGDVEDILIIKVPKELHGSADKESLEAYFEALRIRLIERLKHADVVYEYNFKE